MYNLWTTQDESYGLSAFGQVSIPTGSEVDNYKGLFGVGVKATFAPVMVFNGNVHYDPKYDMAECNEARVAVTRLLLRRFERSSAIPIPL